MIASYQQAVDYLYTNLPMFQRIGPAALKKDLTNTIRLCEALGDPHTKFKSIHIAGTNGKGSTAHMIASVMQSAGYKTGLYTSPHLKEFTERIRVNGQEVEKDFVVTFVNKLRHLVDSIKPSFFEITVAMAFDYFAFCSVDMAVVEVGLGGRLDSTNIILPEIALITNIGKDHTDLLGDSLEQIAMEKAGIIKEKIPVVISERQQAVDSVFTEVAGRKQSPIYFASDAFRLTEINSQVRIMKGTRVFLDNIVIPLTGRYQWKNILGVMQTLELLRDMGYTIDDNAIRHGLMNVIVQTGLKGRWQTIRQHPLMICDTGHNVDGLREVVDQINLHQYDNLHIVLGMVKDKNLEQMLDLLPKHAHYYFCQATIPRALDASVLAEQAGNAGLAGIVIPDVNEAIALALQAATPNDFIFIGGSTFVVAEINNL